MRALLTLLLAAPALASPDGGVASADAGSPDAATPTEDAPLGPDPDAPLGPDPDAPLGPEPDAPLGPEPDAPLGPEPDAPLAPEPKVEPTLPPAPPSPVAGPTSDEPAVLLPGVSIFGTEEERARRAGAASAVNEEALETYEYNDVHRALQQVTGIYVRDEEGFGLRPNIGLRGASSERSAKVTLMEDGVLLTPAPYSAPAAYYFPMTTRMTAVEVFKGPAAVEFGPNTIGGAINMVTRGVPERGHEGMVDIAGGQHGFTKAHAHYGQAVGRGFGVVLEAVDLRSTGFKSLDGGGDTGFEKRELMLKLRQRFGADDAPQSVQLKLGYADETSRETYLGLSDADFEADPYRRYAASQEGRMQWERLQGVLDYSATLGSVELRATLYRHDFERGWRKLNGFDGGPSIAEVLANPDSGRSALFFGILSGQEDSTPGVDEEALRIGTNLRTFVSQGAQTQLRWKHDGETWFNELRAGLRVHHDQIQRKHSEGGFTMQSGVLVPQTPENREPDETANNLGRSIALALHVVDEYAPFKGLYLTPGIRGEMIRTDFEERLGGSGSDATDFVWVPGLGVYWQALESLGVLAGVHKGFSAVAPGQADAVEPESSINYEAGLRFAHAETRAELIGFFNDYGNMSSECTFSTGCDPADLNAQLNAGEVFVYGLEASAHQAVSLPATLSLEVDLSYTLTLSDFRTGFTSVNPQLGQVEEGDELPYVPVHQLNGRVALLHPYFQVFASVTHVGDMRDVAGQGEIPASELIEAHTVLDVGAAWPFTEADEIYLRADNLLDTEYMASRRPFGARPGKPLSVFAGYKHRFGSP